MFLSQKITKPQAVHFQSFLPIYQDSAGQLGCSEIAVKIELWISFDPISEKKSSVVAIQSPQIPQKGRTAGSHRPSGDCITRR